MSIHSDSLLDSNESRGRSSIRASPDTIGALYVRNHYLSRRHEEPYRSVVDMNPEDVWNLRQSIAKFYGNAQDVNESKVYQYEYYKELRTAIEGFYFEALRANMEAVNGRRRGYEIFLEIMQKSDRD